MPANTAQSLDWISPSSINHSIDNGEHTFGAIAKDGILSRCKLISEPWDCGGLYLVGRFPNWDRWAEWNGKYRDDVRRFIKDLPRRNVLYGYRIDGPKYWHQGHRFDNSMILLDPYAKLIEGRRIFGDARNKISQFLGTYDFDSLPFDWGENYVLPNIPEKDLVIYEMNVRAFTADESSGLDSKIRGSYLGVIEKIPHLLELGINAVELLPVFEFDELEFQRRPNPRDHMINTWGYSTINFFAPMSRYASNGGGPSNASRELKEMVKALHDAGIEVILDVVYNHTNEADDKNPYTTSFRGIDNKVIA
ncbi:unnamed protein product [Fraxinus pennsylvanica]|uniref:Glycosyl hydrolase family 13 catalytic domain-containing protein n=1 Tax=Fraxinus pennsylvanica TaxID=56036 RepID=A0AAD1YRG5_9LAMI|nr:unnamed protein product [Fraxinus pennsylvanica]